MAGVSRNLQLKLDLAAHLAGHEIQMPKQALLVQQIARSLEKSIGADIEHVAYTKTGEITVWVEKKPIEIGLAINNVEIGSPRPWALARSLGHVGEGSLDEPYQKAIQKVEDSFFTSFGKSGFFTDSSRNHLQNSFTDLMVTWIGNPTFMTRNAISLAAAKWVGWGKCTIFVNGQKNPKVTVLNLAESQLPTQIKIGKPAFNRFDLDFGIEQSFTCRVHTDSKGWGSGKRLPVKLSFEFN
jgi:hypothetical protein